jgi:pimeloyl-ACP methyl ester carboxylesterase
MNYMRRGSGPPLVLIHGFLGGIEEWERLTDALAPSYDVIALDLPGFGGSADIPPPSSIGGYGLLIMELLGRLGVRKCTLFGHSLGSMIVQQIALDHAGRFDRLVLYGAASTGTLPGRFETFATTIERIRRIGIAQAAEPIIASWFVQGPAHPAFPLYRRMAERASSEAAIAALSAVAAWRVTERLGEIVAPALVIGGDRDRSTEPAEQLRLYRGLQQGRLCILPNCAHAAHLEAPELFIRLVQEFLGAR